jgi:hypothetical protein
MHLVLKRIVILIISLKNIPAKLRKDFKENNLLNNRKLLNKLFVQQFHFLNIYFLGKNSIVL